MHDDGMLRLETGERVSKEEALRRETSFCDRRKSDGDIETGGGTGGVVRRQLEAVPNKKEIISATAAVTAATAAISTAISEPLMTMAGSVVAFSLVKSFETMDKQLRQKQREIETKKREENVDLLMKSKERKVETKVEVVDTPLEVVSATTTVEDVAKKEEGKIVEKEEEILAPASTTATTATTTAKSISATGAFASKIASENESAVFEARKRREKILNEMAQYDDARLNSIVRTTGEMAETTTTTTNNNNNNKFRQSSVETNLGHFRIQRNTSTKFSRRSGEFNDIDGETGRRTRREDAKNQSFRSLLRRVHLSVYAFIRTLQRVRRGLEKVLRQPEQRESRVTMATRKGKKREREREKLRAM